MSNEQIRQRSRPTVPALRWTVAAGLALAAALALAPARPAFALAWHWPWHHHARSAPAGILTPGLTIRLEGAGSTAAVTQSWDRNTLLVDLTHLGGSGSATLTPPPSAGWPVRLAFRVQPGSIGSLEVEGAQRVQYTVPTHGAAMTVQLDPGIYVVKTPSLTLHWSAADGLPH